MKVDGPVRGSNPSAARVETSNEGGKRLRPSDFIPAPFDIATCKYHTGLDPFTKQPVQPPKEAIDTRRKQANHDHDYTVANPARGEAPGKRAAQLPQVGNKGYRPGRKTPARRDGIRPPAPTS